MKKNYSKPYLAIETFQLDAAIASSCTSSGLQKLGFSMDTCTLEEEQPGLNYFGDKCIHDVKIEGDGNDLICYHGPTPASSMYMNS